MTNRGGVTGASPLVGFDNEGEGWRMRLKRVWSGGWRRIRRSAGAVVAIAVASSSLAACQAEVTLAYTPSANPPVVAGAAGVVLAVTAIDKRAQFRDRVSTKNGLAASPVVPTNDVVDLVRSAVEAELKAEGFRIGIGGGKVVIDVQNFYNDFVLGSSHFAKASVTFTLRVKDANDATRYTQIYDGSADERYTFSETANTAKLSLDRALADAVRQVTDDKALQGALLSLAAESQPAPAR